MLAYPNKSVPGGCVIGLFGLLAWLYSGFCVYSLWGILRSEDKPAESEIPWDLVLRAGVSFLVGLALLVIGWRLALRVGGYDPWDPDEPRMKF